MEELLDGGLKLPSVPSSFENWQGPESNYSLTLMPFHPSTEAKGWEVLNIYIKVRIIIYTSAKAGSDMLSQQQPQDSSSQGGHSLLMSGLLLLIQGGIVKGMEYTSQQSLII